MMKPQVLKKEAEYKAALEHVATLMDAAPGSPEEDELELFSLLIEAYEQEHYPIDLPDPIEAIKFRMEQAGLYRKDMIPYLGSQSKVSEVLNRKRPLSLSMIRALHQGLGIPAEVLLQQRGREIPEQSYQWRDFPFSEMVKRSYLIFHGTPRDARLRAESLLIDFFSVLEGIQVQPIYCKRANREVDTNALVAWQARVLHLAREDTLPAYDPSRIDMAALAELVKSSCSHSGPQRAREILNRWGIHLIILRHLPKTYLDGASFLSTHGQPIIGLTCRHDRLDNFWFTLLHELGHIRLHLRSRGQAFFDETVKPSRDARPAEEQEADEFARDCLISTTVWEQVAESLLADPAEQAVIEASQELGIHPAIVAGRVRWETGDYRHLGSLVGRRQVRDQFASYLVEPCQE
jgi:HTH-type transcriptional regulator/antitoxin HigA